MRARRTRTRDAIVCGTDFSDHARHAAHAGAVLAALLRRPLLLVHVDQDVRSGKLPAGTRRELMQPKLTALRREADLLRTRGVKVIEELHEGNPDEILVRRAGESGASLVVVGSLGTRAGGRWLMGSVSERTAESSRVPTLVVRSDAPFEAWLRRERPLRVFVAFDFTVTAEAAVDWVGTLLKAGSCEITVGYVNWPPEERQRFGVSHTSPFENAPSVQQALERDVRDRVTALLGIDDVPVRVLPTWGRADIALLDAAAQAQADLIVTGTHQRHGLPRLWEASVSRGVLHHAPMSVVCVPVAATARAVPPVPAIRRVLVTTDFSSAGNRAIAHALALMPRGGALRVVHVVHPRAIAGGQFEKGLRNTPRHTSHAQALGRQLQGLLPAEAESMGVSVEAAVVESEDVDKAICQDAERYGADVIVMASQGLTGLTRAVLGSVAQAVMTKSRRPVLIVRWPRD